VYVDVRPGGAPVVIAVGIKVGVLRGGVLRGGVLMVVRWRECLDVGVATGSITIAARHSTQRARTER